MKPAEFRRQMARIAHPQGQQRYEAQFGKPLEVDSSLPDSVPAADAPLFQPTPPPSRDRRFKNPDQREYSIVEVGVMRSDGGGAGTQMCTLNATVDVSVDENAELIVGGVHDWVGPATYDCGTVVLIEVVASPAYHFTEWTGDVPAGDTTNNPIYLTMDSDKTIVAWFAAD